MVSETSTTSPPSSSTTCTPPTVTEAIPAPTTPTSTTTTTMTLTAPVTQPTIIPPSSSNVSTPMGSCPSTPASMVSDTPDPAPGERAVQTNKGRCFLCRAKAAPKHDCDFDFAKMGKDLLTKNNPRLNEKPRGGRSFTRIQE
ncbi:hypothetical protein BGZ52_009917 [Haplosporangium bisporale]|nr:hypothetical protein BGZ52_009917 [Haplosporangium bisporale]